MNPKQLHLALACSMLQKMGNSLAESRRNCIVPQWNKAGDGWFMLVHEPSIDHSLKHEKQATFEH